MALAALTFDIDDTLWDNVPVMLKLEEAHFEHLAHLAQQDLPLTSAEYAKRRQLLAATLTDRRGDMTYIRRTVIDQLFTELGFSNSQASQLTEQAIEYMLTLRHMIKPFAEVMPLLADLHQEYRLASITNGNVDIFRLPLGQFFHFAYKAGELGMPKPDPAIFYHALNELGQFSPQQAAHIGDSWQYDIAPALAIGMFTVWIQPDQPPAQLAKKLYRIPHVNLLKDVLKEFNAQ